MTQPSFFGRTELSAMRDSTKRRNYSPSAAEFRRDHKRRRDHGKALRHARRIYLDFQESCPDEPPPFPPISPNSQDAGRASPGSTIRQFPSR
ncbi:hypothetical protein AB0J83_42415 [Actinoplanes sp. NPDC049596]|uniref:hypothetical protein n=1 Tax=unclassified Actinoplanes TaxID=2626549 RepID=UPI00343CA1EF